MKKRIFFVLLCVLFIIGCNRSPIPGLVPASGTILLDGKPIDGVSIVFTPQTGTTSDRIASTVSLENGTFILNILGYSGALPGKYNVVLLKETLISKVSPEEEEKMLRDGEIPPEPEHVYHIPKDYQSAVTSGIVIEIPEEGNTHIRIELQSK
jgi:hypothetical protein